MRGYCTRGDSLLKIADLTEKSDIMQHYTKHLQTTDTETEKGTLYQCWNIDLGVNTGRLNLCTDQTSFPNTISVVNEPLQSYQHRT